MCARQAEVGCLWQGQHRLSLRTRQRSPVRMEDDPSRHLAAPGRQKWRRARFPRCTVGPPVRCGQPCIHAKFGQLRCQSGGAPHHQPRVPSSCAASEDTLGPRTDSTQPHRPTLAVLLAWPPGFVLSQRRVDCLSVARGRRRQARTCGGIRSLAVPLDGESRACASPRPMWVFQRRTAKILSGHPGGSGMAAPGGARPCWSCRHPSGPSGG